MKISEVIKNRIESAGARYWANDNISEFIKDNESPLLINEITEKFEAVLNSMLIDTKTDPNSNGTAHRLAKMYVNEVMSGRFVKAPNATAFPNAGNERYEGMLVVRAELNSVCSHHWKDVKGVAYIGVIPNEKVIGLSKYIRIAQWCARRGTLQEALCGDICNKIMEATDSKDVAVYLQATHGCVSCRGVGQENSLTQTTVLKGEFKNPDVKKEFFDNIAIQENFAKRG